MNKYYTGIGSRETPKPVLIFMTGLAMELEREGLILRSGGAEGADSAFRAGITNPKNCRIYVPWDSFCPLLPSSQKIVIGNHSEYAKIASEIHPAWDRLTPGAKLLHTRNVAQILGEDGVHSKFVVCWTKDGLAIGGTATAIKLARKYKIPVYNLGDLFPENMITNEPLTCRKILMETISRL